MDSMRNKSPGIDSAAVNRCRDQAHFWYCLVAHIAQPHQRPYHQPKRFDPIFQGCVGLQFSGRLRTRHTQIGSPDQHHGHTVINTGDRQTIDPVNHIAGG